MEKIKFLLRKEKENFLFFNSQKGIDITLTSKEVEELKKGRIKEKLSNFGFKKENLNNIKEIDVRRESNPNRISFPKRIILDLTNECQIKCFYCYMNFDENSEFMSTDYAINIINKYQN